MFCAIYQKESGLKVVEQVQFQKCFNCEISKTLMEWGIGVRYKKLELPKGGFVIKSKG